MKYEAVKLGDQLSNLSKHAKINFGETMTKTNLRFIAEQVHSGKKLHQIDFGNAKLNPMGMLVQRNSALRKFPTPESVWDSSNEAVIAIKDEPPVSAPNIQPLKVGLATQSHRPVLPAKTRSKLTLTDQWRKSQLFDDLLEAETALLEAREANHAGTGDWRAVHSSELNYRKGIDHVNTFIHAVHVDQKNYFSKRSKRWQESEKGQAYQKWMEKWDVEFSSNELPVVLMGVKVELKNNLRILLELRDEPSV